MMARLDWSRWLLVLVAAFAAGLQVRRGLGPLGITGLFSVADLLLPAVLAALVVREGLPSWRLRSLPHWMMALTAVLALALAWGRLQMGEWFAWAVINKAAGWIVVLAYLAAGGLIAADPTRRAVFLRWAILAGAGVSALSLVVFVGRGVLPGPLAYILIDSAQRLNGLVANPNAFGLLSATLLLLHLAGWRDGGLGLDRLRMAVAVVLLIAVALSGSRSVWLGIIIGMGVLAMAGHLPLRPLVLAGGIGAAGVAVVIGAILVRDPDTLLYVLDSPAMRLQDIGTSQRFAALGQAFAMWWDNPLLGGGLGRFYHDRIAEGVDNPQTIHNTALWLMAETGLLGFAAVAGFSVAVSRRLWRDRRDWLAAAGLAVVGLFAAASLTTEILFQRPLWLALGIALAAVHHRRTENA